MDISTLPDEMLTNILSKTSYGNVRSMRKLNRRINNVAKRAEISTRVSVQKFALSSSMVVLSLSETDAVSTNTKMRTFQNRFETTEDLSEVMDKWLAKVEIFQLLEISGRQYNMNEKTLNVMEKHRGSTRNLEKFSLLTEFSLTTHLAERFLCKVCPNLNSLSIHSPRGEAVENMINQRVVGIRKWKRLSVSCNDTELLNLDDQFMLKVVPNCESFWFDCKRTSFTLKGAMELLEKVFMKGDDMQFVVLGPILLGNVALDKVKEFIMHRVPGVTVESWDNQYEQKKFVIGMVGRLSSLPLKNMIFIVDLTQL